MLTDLAFRELGYQVLYGDVIIGNDPFHTSAKESWIH